MNKYRSHNCSELSVKNIGKKIRLSGWIHRKRDHGNLLFIDIRDHFGVTVINSGKRGPSLNEAVGGSSKSQHCKGEAVDIECPGTSNYAVANWIEQNLDFDQLILEFYTPGIPDSGWVHVSYKSEGNRKSILTAMKENGKTVYKPGLIE